MLRQGKRLRGAFKGLRRGEEMYPSFDAPPRVVQTTADLMCQAHAGGAETKQCEQCGKRFERLKDRPSKAWKAQKYCSLSCAYKNTGRKPEHQCMECHVAVGIGVNKSARLVGKSNGGVSNWRKNHGLKTAAAPSPRWLSLEERAKRAQEEAFVREQRAWANAGRLACWSRWGHVQSWRRAHRYGENIIKERERGALSARRRHERLKHNPEYKMKRLLRNAVSRICRKSKTQKDRRVIEYVGCRMTEARQHIERQFAQGMTWDNHGKLWEVDHIIPLSHFNLTNLSQRLAANHYTNLQPLWKWQNRAKASKLCLN